MTAAPPCHRCGGGVFIYDPAAPQEAICVECCGHPEYVYERGEGHRCVACFGEAPASYYEGMFDE